jgi:para-nitrobenzyl esterase
LEVEDMADAAIVQTDCGPVRGTATNEYRLFQGIPYAASTAGDHRWRAPAPVQAWTEPREATKPGNICAQQPSVYADVASLEEDCLFLNVTTPRWMDADRLRPVMVWIHGDGAIGAGSFFDASRLANTGDVIVVTINYRLGVFGVFGYPGLNGSGTFGLQDQRAALQWVQRNAAAFGGDPDNVTLFGESYGGLATSAHLTSPQSRGLFHRAIIQSGFALMDLPAGALYPGVPAVEWFGWQSAAEVEATGAAVAAQLGCTDPTRALECLRRRPVQDLVTLSRPMPFAYGNPVLPEVPAHALRKGRFHQVLIMSGGTRDEHRLFVGLFRVLAGQPVTAQQYPALLSDAFGEHASAVHAQYSESAFESPSVAWASVLTDRMWARSTFEQHQLFTAHVPTYAYEFADRGSPMYLPFPESFPPGAFHAAEVPYLFNDDKFEAAANLSQRRLSAQMMRYWGNFAHTGDPNGDGLPHWSPFDRPDAVQYVQSLAPDAIRGVDYAAEHHLDFWSQLP